MDNKKTASQIRAEITELAKPLCKYLMDNHSPYTDIIVGVNSVKLVEEIAATDEVIPWAEFEKEYN
jgi:hypothetical protein